MPLCSLGIDTTSGDDEVDIRMVIETARVGVQYRRHRQFGIEALFIQTEGFECGHGTVEQQGKSLRQSKFTGPSYRNLNIWDRFILTLRILPRLERVLNGIAQYSSLLPVALATRRVAAALAVGMAFVFLSACYRAS